MKWRTVPPGLARFSVTPAGWVRLAAVTDRIYLSPPSVGPAEEAAVLGALRSGWVAPVGPDLDAFEAELAARAGRSHCVALSSGTAGLHTLLVALGVGPGDDVLVSTLTFVASVNPIRYVGANPVLIDSEPVWWNIDPELVDAELGRRQAAGRRVGAVVAVDLYGRCVDRSLEAICAAHGVPLLVDAAESLGASRDGVPAGGTGVAGLFSFNGNKIITTSGGGAVVTDDEALALRVRHLATQAREPAVHYEHVEVGFNYRLSNVLAALGRAQLAGLDGRIERRRAISNAYRDALADIEGVVFPDPAADDGWNGWLTCVLLDPEAGLPTSHEVVDQLERKNIEARPAWKPMHRQPLYAGADACLTGVADRVFDLGLCLPSGHALSDADFERVLGALREALGE